MQPTVASGEMFQSFLTSKRIASGTVGLERSASEIGTSDSDSAMATMAKSSKPPMPMPGMRYCAAVTEPRSTRR